MLKFRIKAGWVSAFWGPAKGLLKNPILVFRNGHFSIKIEPIGIFGRVRFEKGPVLHIIETYSAGSDILATEFLLGAQVISRKLNKIK